MTFGSEWCQPFLTLSFFFLLKAQLFFSKSLWTHKKLITYFQFKKSIPHQFSKASSQLANNFFHSTLLKFHIEEVIKSSEKQHKQTEHLKFFCTILRSTFIFLPPMYCLKFKCLNRRQTVNLVCAGRACRAEYEQKFKHDFLKKCAPDKKVHFIDHFC